MRSSVFFVLPFALCAVTAPSRAIANCRVGNGVSQASPIYTDDTHTGGMNHVICTQTVTIYPGTSSCEVIQRDAATGSSGANCLHLGRGVKFSGNPYYHFTCPSGVSCGTAIAVDQPASSGTSQINDVYIEGGWATGISNSYPTVSAQVNSATVDLDPSITSTCGIDGFKTINTSYVTDMKGGSGVCLYGGATVDGSSIYGNDNGIFNSGSNVLSNSLLADNAVNILTDSGTLSSLDMRGVTVRHASTCDCSRTVGGCTFDIFYCGSFSGTNVSFLGNVIEQ